MERVFESFEDFEERTNGRHRGSWHCQSLAGQADKKVPMVNWPCEIIFSRIQEDVKCNDMDLQNDVGPSPHSGKSLQILEGCKEPIFSYGF